MALDKMERAIAGSRHKKRDKWLRTLSFKRAILAALYRKENNREAAGAVLEQALANPLLNGFQRRFIKAAYAYTARGGRGAASLINMIM